MFRQAAGIDSGTAVPNKLIQARLRAALIHLGASVTLALVLILLVTQVWYPSPLFDLAKGKEIFLILIGCDITLGPVMTLIVFNMRKPRAELVRDISIIAIVQLSAMIYGVSILLQARPAYIVYNVGQFNVPLANELTNGNDEKGAVVTAPIPAAPWFGPQLVGTRLPTENAEHNRLLFSSVSGQGDVFEIPRYFVPYEEVRAEVMSHAQSVAQIAATLQVDPGVVDAAISTYKNRGQSIGLLPLVVRKTVALAVVDAKTGDLLGIAPLPPRI